MNGQSIVRLGIAAVIVLGVALLLVLCLLASNLVFSAREQLQQAPPWVNVMYGVALALFVVAGAFVIWRLLKPTDKGAQALTPPDEAQLRADIERHAMAGVPWRSPFTERSAAARPR
jgi:ABC-type nickel/cobalt efflux system permease component RcnA